MSELIDNKRGRGRPYIDEKRKVKGNAKTIRIPLGIADTLEVVASSYKKSLISLEDIQLLAGNNSKGKQG
jgi:hypothetical protein